MADEKLSDLPSVTPATGDLLYLVDISDTTDSAAGSSKPSACRRPDTHDARR